MKNKPCRKHTIDPVRPSIPYRIACPGGNLRRNKAFQPGSCLVLLSGGLDSVVSMAMARRKLEVVLALTIDYGQRSAEQEIKAANRICRYLRIRHFILDLAWLGQISRSALTSKKLTGLKRFSLVKDVWVPNRNGLFLSIGAAIAEAMGVKYLITGFNKEEGTVFPDNSRKFIDAFNKSLRFSTLNRVRVRSFVQDLSKIQIVRLGLKLRVPLNLVYSCYLGKARMCGRCSSCRRFKRALQALGIFSRYEKYFDE